VSSFSSVLTFARGVDWAELLRASGQPDNPVVRQMMTGLFQGPAFLTAAAVFGAAFLGYLIWIKRYFPEA
jgi:hypothetical protein